MANLRAAFVPSSRNAVGPKTERVERDVAGRVFVVSADDVIGELPGAARP